MLIYEVNLDIDRSIKLAFDTWLATHIQEILALPGFTHANPYVVDSEKPDRVAYCIQYHLKDRNALENYLQNHAPRLRTEGMQRFPGKFTATRRVLSPAPIL